ncbi:DUF502 domain-containing protein [Corticimicrobacter populi]|uniref:DUF502 domain-containing protein n=1 Tax=Corticimicrobacter populi TaxID=2175229 RepID=A0A2V1K486_9BURK|nr:DUF502 domain-containing protein [Corticimicrobacter populi]PWF25390.1 hypothetical protein DD235_04425 [Corticimicrobacter populi]
MSRLYKYFFRGVIAILPLALTLYLLYIFLFWMENMSMSVLHPFFGNFYIPGMGLVLGVLIIMLIGYLASLERIQKLFLLVELPFNNLPVVKSIYSSIKNFADYFSSSTKAGSQQVVLLRMPGHQFELVGLVTRRDMEGLPEGFLPGSRVAVYLPMGYMIGGYTVFVPESWVHPIQMSVEEAMRSSLIAWMARADASQAMPPVPPIHPEPPPATGHDGNTPPSPPPAQ